MVLGALPHAQPAPAARESFDADFARSVREWTTAPEFLSPLVDQLPLVKGIPTPKDVLGYHVGTPKRLTKTDAALAYYRALEKASPRIRVTTIGKTDEGRDVTVVYIANEATLKNLATHTANLGRLADPRGLPEDEAKRLIAITPPMYHLMAGLHSAETGPPEMLMELAYRLVASETPLIRQIRDRIIVSLTPASDPDGRDRYIDWYRKHMVDITEEKDRISGPPYWGKYIFHDNNRDINYSQVTMRAHLAWYLKTHPPVMHDLHESVPFLYTFSGQAPQNPNLDPIVYGELPTFANFEMMQLTKYGMPGVWTHGFVDMWSPGYLAFMSSNHNGLIRMYETFGNGGATTMKRKVAPPDGAGQTSREWYRPLPPYKEVTWSMRNNTNYMQTAVLSALQYASSFPDVLVENFYRKSRNSVEAGQKEAPYAYVVPAGQKDLTRVDLLLSLLQLQGIEVSKASGEITLSDGTFPAGSYVIKRDQPYGRLVKTLLEKQTFPDQSLRTYDDTGWTMGLMLQVEVKPTADKKVLDAPVTRVTDLSRTGVVNGQADPAAWVVAHQGSNDMVRLRLALGAGADVRAARVSFKVGETSYPAGSFLVPGSAGTTFTDAVKRLGLEATGLASRPDVATVAGGSAAPRDVQHLGPYAGGGLGAARLRHVRYSLRADLQGADSPGRAAPGLRRDPDPEPGHDGQVPGVRRRAQGGPARLSQGPAVPHARHVWRDRRRHRRHGPAGRDGVAEVRGGRRRADHARGLVVHAGGVRAAAGGDGEPSDRRVLCARADRAGRDPAHGTSDLLRLLQDHRAGALRQRPAVPGAGGRRAPSRC